MSEIDDGGPVSGAWQYDERGVPTKTHGGMTLRDSFAAQALVGILANDPDRCSEEGFAQEAYLIDDAMIAERKKEK